MRRALLGANKAMSSGFDSGWLLRHQLRQMHGTTPGVAVARPEADTGTESDLHDKIHAECRRRGWVVVHSRMDRPTTSACGVCDFIIFQDGGNVLCVECKSRVGKLSLDQNGFIAAMRKNGHNVQVVRSYSEFLQIVPHDTYT